MRVYKKDYELIKKEVKGFEHSFDDYLEKMMLVTSRSIPIKINGEKTTALIPLADMINHNH